MKTFLISGALVIFLALGGNEKLIGRWESLPSEKGNVTGVVFKSDNSMEGYVNRKPFVTGIYEFKDSILSFVDNGCDGKRGFYKVVFFSNEDSIRFVAVSDSCGERKNGMSRLVLGRKK